MANLVFDPKKGQEAAETLVAVCNGKAQDQIVELYQLVKSLGEGNPVVDDPMKVLRQAADYFNDEFVPCANKIKGHFEEYSELASAILAVDSAKVAAGEDMGQVADTTYDAAAML